MDMRIAVLGAGGLGRGMARMVMNRPGFRLVAMADRSGFAYDANGLSIDSLGQVAELALFPEVGVHSSNSIVDLLKVHGEEVDAMFLALPNLPVDFFYKTLQSIADETPFQGVMVDALKRTKAVELLLGLDVKLRGRRLLHITGAGATPGFLTTMAAVAAQSFVEVLKVDIHFGVGVSDWEAYRATIREDLIHLDGFDAHRVARMSDADIQEELDKRNGLLELHKMEHADDIILELAGICSRDRITVGGLVDTRSAKKPVSTTVTVQGRTMDGRVGAHTFTVSDETTMVDNVCGPALGFMDRGLDLWKRGTYGLMTSADLMPKSASLKRLQQVGSPAESARELLVGAALSS